MEVPTPWIMELPPPWIEFPELAQTSRASGPAAIALMQWVTTLSFFPPHEVQQYQQAHPAPEALVDVYQRVAEHRVARQLRKPGPSWQHRVVHNTWKTPTPK
jgi:hypothetical protein